MEQKAALRDRWLAWRDALPPAQLAEGVARAGARLLGHPWWARAQTVALYAALPGEPDLAFLSARAWAEGKRVALPITPRRGHPLAWRLHRRDVPLTRGRFDVPVPPHDAPEVDPASIDVVLVPAMAVDAEGHRLGYGGGYYDRSLPGMTTARRIWIGLDAQVGTPLPREPWDVPLDALVTPTLWLDLSASPR